MRKPLYFQMSMTFVTVLYASVILWKKGCGSLRPYKSLRTRGSQYWQNPLRFCHSSSSSLPASLPFSRAPSAFAASQRLVPVLERFFSLFRRASWRTKKAKPPVRRRAGERPGARPLPLALSPRPPAGPARSRAAPPSRAPPSSLPFPPWKHRPRSLLHSRRLSLWAPPRWCCRCCCCRWRWPRAARRCAACGGAGSSAAGMARCRSEQRCRAAFTPRCSAGASSRYGTPRAGPWSGPSAVGSPSLGGRTQPPKTQLRPAAARPHRGSSQASFGGCRVLSPA